MDWCGNRGAPADLMGRTRSTSVCREERLMTKKQWRKPEVKRIEAGSAEGVISGDAKRDSGQGNNNKS